MKKGSIIKRLGKTFYYLILTTILLFFLSVGGLKIYDRIKYYSFYEKSEQAFEIPYLSKGFIPQGFCYYDDTYYISAYHSSKASAILVKGEKDKYVNLSSNNLPYKGHVGGIAINDDYIYIANGSTLDIFSYPDLLQAKTNTSIEQIGKFELKGKASYVSIYENNLYVGEFYRKGNYETDSSHKIGENHAILFQYALDTTESFGITKNPKAGFSIPNQVQGVAFMDQTLILSTSYGIASSKFLFYDLSKEYGKSSLSIDDFSIEITILNEKEAEKTVITPPMSEEVIVVDGKIIYINESASSKYIFGKFTSGKYAYQFE